MAASNAICFPVYGQAFRVIVAFRDIFGNLLTGWTGASAMAYPDNGTGVTCTIAESPAGSGIGTVDIPAAQMSCTSCTVVASITNTNATASVTVVNPVNLSQFSGRWDAQSLLLLERLWLQISILQGINGGSTNGAQKILNNPDGSQNVQASITQGQTSGSASKFQ